MKRNEEITEKLRELVQLSSEDGTETPTQIILLSLLGARAAHQDSLLAKVVQSYVKDVLMPMAIEKNSQGKINLN